MWCLAVSSLFLHRRHQTVDHQRWYVCNICIIVYLCEYIQYIHVSACHLRRLLFICPSLSVCLSVPLWRELEMWQSWNSNSTTFELRTFSADSKFNAYFKRFVVKCEFMGKSLFCDWFHMQGEPETAEKLVFFLQIQPVTQTTPCARTTSTFLFFKYLCQKLTDFNDFGCVKSWENLTSIACTFAHLTCLL